MRAFFTFAFLSLSVGAATAEDMRFGLPIACTPKQDCWLQNYPDRDRGPDISDFACGRQSYDGHDGTDIRLLDTQSKADVIAAAAGTVKAVRDGEPDRLVKSSADLAAVADRECGNGVLIVHGDGWETQYCHMKQGSVSVEAGQAVSAGQKLGSVGFSGQAAFPHVHLTIRKDGKALDPFAPDPALACGMAQVPLWTEKAAAALPYQRGSVLRAGFAPGKVTTEDLETGGNQILDAGSPELDWPAIVAYGWAINLEAGDEISVSLDGPGDFDAENRVVLDRSKAQYLLFSGKPKPRTAGEYLGRFTVKRDGQTVLEETWRATFD